MSHRPPPTDISTRATSKSQTPPPGNLKERIAALQQRSVSPNTHQSAQAASRGLPSPGSGGLRDKIAKFEKKGGVPVPRGSIGMGAPQLAENAPPKKRGELYGNRVPSLGKPSGAPVGSRSSSPLPPTADDAPSPRKRCISTGASLSSSPSKFSTDEPVPALPNGVAGGAHRRNSLALNFGSGRRVMSESDAEGRAGDASSPSSASLVPEKPPDAQPPIPESAGEATPLEVPQPQPLSVKTATVTVSPSPVVEQWLPADSGKSTVETPADPPAPKNDPSPLYDASRNVSQSSSSKQSSQDGLSDYESAPQSASSQQSSSLPTPAPSTPSIATKSPPARAKSIVSLSSPPSEKVKKQVVASRDSVPTIPTPSPTSPTFPTPNPTTESRPQSKPAFKAVVHRKVTEPPVPPAASNLAPPETQQSTKQRRSGNNVNAIQVPPSPAGENLAILLEDAAMLEWRLTEGGDSAGSRAKELLETTPTSATFQPDPRQASASTLTEYASVPSVDSGSLSTRSVSIPSIREPLIDGEIPEGEETDRRSLASTTFSQRSPSSRKYLSNIYRLTGRRSSGAYPRDSMSMSSEDSSPVTTPPSDNDKRKGFGLAWPSGSPKKGTPNVSRSSSFADKIFNRNRTRSNVSTADQASERNSLYQSSQPSLTLTFPPETHADGVDIGARPTSCISPGDSNSEFSPTSSLLDKDIFDAFPSVPQTLPPGFHLDADNAGGRSSTLSVNGRKQVNQRLSMA